VFLLLVHFLFPEAQLSCVELVQTDLLTGLMPRLNNTVDLLVRQDVADPPPACGPVISIPSEHLHYLPLPVCFFTVA
jgi:hypothetical protein